MFFHTKDRVNSLAVSWAMNSLAYSIVYPFIPIYLNQERGIPIETVGTIFPLMGVAIILMPPLAGILTDRFGRRFMMQFGQNFRAAIFLVLAVMAYFNAPFWLFAVMLMLNAGIGTFFQVASDSYLTDITTAEERPKLYSRIRIGTNIGWALGPMLGAFLARTPFSLMFAVTSLMCAAGAFYTNRNCVESVRHEKSSFESERAKETTLLHTFRDVPMMRLLLCSFLLFLLTSQLYSILSVYSTSVVGVSKNVLGFVYSVNGFTIIFLQIPLTHLADKLKASLQLRLLSGAALYACGYFSLAFCHTGFDLGMAVFTLTLGEIIVQPALYTSVSKLASGGGVASYMAAMSLIRGIGFAVGPWIGAIVFKNYSSSPVILWGMLACFAVAAGIGFIFVSMRRGSADA